jgi:hypothetical protein
MVMQTVHNMTGIPAVFPQFLTDDFGDEVITVYSILDDMNSFQIQIDERTYWHMEALNEKIVQWENGNREE